MTTFPAFFFLVTKLCFRRVGVPETSVRYHISTKFSYRFISSSVLVFQTCSTAWLNHLVPVRIVYRFPILLQHLYDAVAWRIAEIQRLRLAALHRIDWSFSRLVESSWNVMAHGDAREWKWRGNWRMEWVASILHTTSNMVYPALLPLMRTPQLPVVDWTDVPDDLNVLVRFAERRNLVSMRVP